MLRGQVINSEAVLNTLEVIGSLDFIAGEAFTLAMRVYQPQRTDKLRFVPPAASTLTFHLPNTDGTVTDLAGVAIDVLDKSLWSVAISSLISANLMSGNFSFTLDLLGDGTKLVQGFVENGLSLIVTGACLC